MNAMTDMKSQSRALSCGILNPANLHEALEMAGVLAKSSLIPKDFQNNPGNVLVAIQWGLELGLAPMQALQSIAVINGRPSLWGDAVMALCQSSPVCEYIQERIEGTNGDMVAVCVTQRRGNPEPIERRFSFSDAKRAGLAGKSGPWAQYPQRMLQMRARSWCLRDAYPDLLRGMAVAEEAQDYRAAVAEPAHAPAPAPAAPALPSATARAAAALAQRRIARQPEPAPQPTVDVDAGVQTDTLMTLDMAIAGADSVADALNYLPAAESLSDHWRTSALSLVARRVWTLAETEAELAPEALTEALRTLPDEVRNELGDELRGYRAQLRNSH
jgi:hypothetical protein